MNKKTTLIIGLVLTNSFGYIKVSAFEPYTKPIASPDAVACPEIIASSSDSEIAKSCKFKAFKFSSDGIRVIHKNKENLTYVKQIARDCGKNLLKSEAKQIIENANLNGKHLSKDKSYRLIYATKQYFNIK